MVRGECVERSDQSWSAWVGKEMGMLREPKYQTGLEMVKRTCLDCSAFNGIEVKNCTVVDCANWPGRFGMKPETAEKKGYMVPVVGAAHPGNHQALSSQVDRRSVEARLGS